MRVSVMLNAYSLLVSTPPIHIVVPSDHTPGPTAALGTKLWPASDEPNVSPSVRSNAATLPPPLKGPAGVSSRPASAIAAK